MLHFTHAKHLCTGCSACYAACPVKCIRMELDEEGFLYPVKSDNCIDCGLCERICPIKNPLKVLDFEQSACAAVSKDDRIWSESASGGAFSEICTLYGDESTIFVGAAFEGRKVHHICVTGIDAISPLRKSKYLESEIGNSFNHIKEYLHQGKKVVFCGTPCQVAGLHAYLGKKYDTLLTIDLICHGVGSPKVFEHCIEKIQMQFGMNVSAYEFRAKRAIHETDHLAKLRWGNGKEQFIVEDPYIQLFLKQLVLRPSCGGNCQFRNEKRQGDLTIADFKGLAQVYPHLAGCKKNYSTVVANSTKGLAVMNCLHERMHILPCTLEDIKKYNPLFARHTWSTAERDVFFADFVRSPQKAIDVWTKPARVLSVTMKYRIKRWLPVSVIRMILKLKGEK